jgi:hypothetical protein
MGLDGIGDGMRLVVTMIGRWRFDPARDNALLAVAAVERSGV